MNTKEQILDLYYNKHLKQNDIAKIVGKSSPYISRIVKTDKRNTKEKETRKQTNKEKRKVYLQDYFANYERPKKKDNTYEQMKAIQKQDAMELSYSNQNLSNYAYAHYNLGAYHRNRKGDLIIDRKLNVGADIPKKVNMNIKVPTQKYKHKYCFSHWKAFIQVYKGVF